MRRDTVSSAHLQVIRQFSKQVQNIMMKVVAADNEVLLLAKEIGSMMVVIRCAMYVSHYRQKNS